MSRRAKYSPKELVTDLAHAFRTSKTLLVPMLLTFIALITVTLFSFDILSFDMFEGEHGCQLSDDAHGNPLERAFYDEMMRLRFPLKTRHHYVSMVTISEETEPLSVITNTCESRQFLALLMRKLSALGASVIAVDESFSENSCPESFRGPDGPVNQGLRDAIQASKPPVVVGWASHKAQGATDKDESCLTVNKKFCFSAECAHGGDPENAKLRFGLIRLNSNVLKIPLQWWVYLDESPILKKEKAPFPSTPTKAMPEKSFSLVAAEFASQKISGSDLHADKHLDLDIKNDEHPYTSFFAEPPTWSAMDVLCYGHPAGYSPRADWPCAKTQKGGVDSLKNQVVVIGVKVASDLKPFPGGSKFGAELHANYIEALLDGRYVKTVNPNLDKGLVFVFVVVMLFLQFLAVRRLPAYEGLEDDTALWLACLIFFIFVLFAWGLFQFKGWFLPIFFLTCFPISLSLVALVLGQTQVILTKKYRRKREGVSR
jgi:CHASE2 domain-containing sensor protein